MFRLGPANAAYPNECQLKTKKQVPKTHLSMALTRDPGSLANNDLRGVRERGIKKRIITKGPILRFRSNFRRRLDLCQRAPREPVGIARIGGIANRSSRGSYSDREMRRKGELTGLGRGSGKLPEKQMGKPGVEGGNPRASWGITNGKKRRKRHGHCWKELLGCVFDRGIKKNTESEDDRDAVAGSIEGKEATKFTKGRSGCDRSQAEKNKKICGKAPKRAMTWGRDEAHDGSAVSGMDSISATGLYF